MFDVIDGIKESYCFLLAENSGACFGFFLKRYVFYIPVFIESDGVKEPESTNTLIEIGS